MPIPVPARSPIKTNSTTPSVATSTKAGTVLQSEPKGPTRLMGGAAPARATSNTSAQRLRKATPHDPGAATNVGHSRARGCNHSVPAPPRSHSSASDRSATRAASAVSVDKAAVAPSLPLPPSRHTVNVRAPGAQSHSPALSASTRRAQGGPRAPNSHESASRPNNSSATHAVSSSVAPKAVLTISGRPPPTSSARPGFSTYQKHISPKKVSTVPAAPVSANSKIAVTSRSAGWGISAAEIENLQDELLQLRLVHETCTATFQAYEDSIKSQLRVGFDDVGKESSVLRSLQHDRQANVNALAASQWLENRRQVAHPTSDTLLLLGHCLNEVQEISKGNGVLADAMQIFDEWCIYASSRRSRRTANDRLDEDIDQSLGFFLRPDPIVAPQWSALIASVEDRVTACASSLADLQRLPDSSSLGLMVNMHMTLTEQILQEIGICREIERLILREEDEWVGTAVEAALCDAESHHTARATQASARRGIWNAREPA